MEQNTTNKPLRRVGTLTLGVCLIAAGTLFLLARFLPGLPWLVIWQVLPAAERLEAAFAKLEAAYDKRAEKGFFGCKSVFYQILEHTAEAERLFLPSEKYAKIAKAVEQMRENFLNGDFRLETLSEECGITRQGVREALKKAEEQLLLYEERLGLLKRQQEEEERKREIVSEMDRLRGEGVDLGALPQLIGGLLGEQNAEDEAL